MHRLNKKSTAKLLIKEKEIAVQADLGNDANGNPISEYNLRVINRIGEELGLTALIAKLEKEQSA